MQNVTCRMTAKTAVKTAAPKSKPKCGWPYPAVNNDGQSQVLERPIVLVIEEKPDRVFLARFTQEGQLVSDSWHMSIDGAKQHASWEFNDPLLDWEFVPADVEDVVSFGLKRSET